MRALGGVQLWVTSGGFDLRRLMTAPPSTPEVAPVEWR